MLEIRQRDGFLLRREGRERSGGIASSRGGAAVSGGKQWKERVRDM